MPFYHKVGKIPPKRHIAFYKEDGKSLYREELVSARGFSGVYSNKYHIFMPTRTLAVKELSLQKPQAWRDAPLQHMHFFTQKKKKPGNFITARDLYLYNDHCSLFIAHVNENTDFFFKNAYHHELLFVHCGTGILYSEYGKLPFGPGDQIVMPKGTTYRMEFDLIEGNKLVVVESDTSYDIPRHYQTEYGQMAEDAPFCERDLRLPDFLEPREERGEFTMILKAGWRNFEYTLDHHPFDVVGWDGFLYPFIFNIRDFAPKVGKIHLPPPVHLVFTTAHFVYCNFCPRLFDFHPQAIPAPYYHHNVDSDEVLYYVEGDFMSRTGIKEGSITLHPTGIPHGPQPGKTEASIGAPKTDEYALMVDTFSPLYPTMSAKETQDADYYRSWLPEDENYL